MASSDFEYAIYVPEHGNLVYRRSYWTQDTDYDASATNYWTFTIVQKDKDGKEILIDTFDGSARAILADEENRLPAVGNRNVVLQSERPLYLKGTKTGSPAATSNLAVQLVLALS